VKAGGRLRFFVTLISILATTIGVGTLVYLTTFGILRRSYSQMLDRSVNQGVYVVDTYVRNQFILLTLYASVPSIRSGQFPDLPLWLKKPEAEGVDPKRFTIIDAEGQGLTSTGRRFDARDRIYFQKALAGEPSVQGPLISRVDTTPVVVFAQPIPGNHPLAAVLTCSVDVRVFRSLLLPIKGLSETELTLVGGDNQEVVSMAGGYVAASGEILESSEALKALPWTLRARVPVDDLMRPVQNVLWVVGFLVVLGAGLVVVFFLADRRHRRDLDQVKEDRTQALRDAYEQIRKLAFHDTVTRLPNRNMVIRKIGEALQARTPLQVIIVALARFRSLTTTFGMHFGDVVLRETATRLSAFLPQEGAAFLGRLSGSEFILLVEDEKYNSSTLPGLLALFRDPMGKDDLRLHMTVHVGACQLLEAGPTAEDVIKSAETALWAARDLGPNEASELTADAVNRRLRRAQLQKLLPEAVQKGEMEVHYQPQVDLAANTVMGYEALLRWNCSELGQVSPVEFIPVAEETGVIVPLGFWVLDQGIAFAKELLNRGVSAVVSVNVSAVQLLHHEFLDDVTRRVEAADLPPRCLGLEITESTLLGGLDQWKPSLIRIMEAGMKVSLDDFGTGYSSLNYLKDLPLHVLKIDKSFIDALVTDDRSFRLIECIIDLAHHLGLIVVAEGIETDRQCELLSEVDCDQVQGFLTGRPQPARHHLRVEV
jgi:diguanylate cyclase (GGDEF)-like protein